MLKVLFIGDIVGRIGRNGVSKILPKLKKEEKIDIVIANTENSAHGTGLTERIVTELEEAGVDYFSGGDHSLRRKNQVDLYNLPNVLRPANYPPGVKGKGYCLIPYKDKNILFVNLIGRVFMKADYDCPFRSIDEILANVDLQAKRVFAIITDIHAEATSEKASMFNYLDGRVTAVLGTHTHVMTADHRISDKNTAFITDVGMVGARDSSIGTEKEGIIRTFLTQINEAHVIPLKGEVVFNSVLLSLSSSTGKVSKIKPITKYININ